MNRGWSVILISKGIIIFTHTYAIYIQLDPIS